jgi:hypothetical protein
MKQETEAATFGSGTGILACLTGFQPVQLAGAGSPGDRLEACPTTLQGDEVSLLKSAEEARPHPVPLPRGEWIARLAIATPQALPARTALRLAGSECLVRGVVSRRDRLPLPGGEGRGEGEPGVAGRRRVVAIAHAAKRGGELPGDFPLNAFSPRPNPLPWGEGIARLAAATSQALRPRTASGNTVTGRAEPRPMPCGVAGRQQRLPLRPPERGESNGVGWQGG